MEGKHVPGKSPKRCGWRIAGTMKRKKQNADTLCHGSSRLLSSLTRYLRSTNRRICSNNFRSSLKRQRFVSIQLQHVEQSTDGGHCRRESYIRSQNS